MERPDTNPSSALTRGAGVAAGSVLITGGSSGTTTLAVMNTSTAMPALSTPPTARSSATVIDTARQASESGATDSSGLRIAKPRPTVPEASRFGVRSWPGATSTASRRPMIWDESEIRLALVPSSGMSLRSTMSVSAMGLRARIGTAAT